MMTDVATAHAQAVADRYTATFGYYTDCVGVEFKGDENALPGGTRTVQLQLSTQTTNRITEACRKLGVSVTSAVHASVASANYILAAPEKSTAHFASTMRFNLRPYLPQRFQEQGMASGLYTTGFASKVPASQSWEQNAREFNGEYKRGVPPELLKSYRQYAINMCNAVKLMPKNLPIIRQETNVDVGPFGVADKFLKALHGSPERGIEVENATVAVEVASPQMEVFLWTFRGRLNLYIVYNESFYVEEEASKFVETVKSVLLEKLCIDEE